MIEVMGTVAIISVLTNIALTVYSGVRHEASAWAIFLNVAHNLAFFIAIAGAIFLSGPIATIALLTVMLASAVGIYQFISAMLKGQMDTVDIIVSIGIMLTFIAFAGAMGSLKPGTSSYKAGDTGASYTTKSGRFVETQIQVRNLNNSNVKVPAQRTLASHAELAKAAGILGKEGNYGLVIQRINGRVNSIWIGSKSLKTNLTMQQLQMLRAKLAAEYGIPKAKIQGSASGAN